MKHIKQAAIKKPSGKVVTKKPPARHKDVAAMDRSKGGTGHGKRGFIAGSGTGHEPGDKFVGRQTAKRIARKAGQAKVSGKRGLHSEDVW